MEKTIYIQAAKAGYKLPIGCSQWWGNPDLPKDIPYPTYINSLGKQTEYQFICQINLEEIALKNPSTRLPHQGLLSFFAKIDHYLGKENQPDYIGNRISEPSDVRVFYFPETTQLEEVVLMNHENIDAAPQEMRMVFSEKQEKYKEEHGLFMPPTHREWETWAPPYETWEILFQLDSCDGEDFHLNIQDGGVLDFIIAPDDLASRRFDNIRAIALTGK